MKLNVRYSRVLCAIVLGSLLILNTQEGRADDDKTAFLPTWKLLNPQEKQQFMAGYLYGWRDASKVTDIALNYVKENPDKAVEGLESIRALYDVSKLNSGGVVREIDGFFQDSDNHDATLMAAISYAKARLR
jgi:hypothetical protein